MTRGDDGISGVFRSLVVRSRSGRGPVPWGDIATVGFSVECSLRFERQMWAESAVDGRYGVGPEGDRDLVFGETGLV